MIGFKHQKRPWGLAATDLVWSSGITDERGTSYVMSQSMIESLTLRLPASQISVRRPWSIRPVVADANALASDVFYAALHNGQTALLHLARFGSIRLFTSAHVYREVYSRLPKLALSGPRRGFLGAAIRIWESEYLPRLRFVRVPDRLLIDPRVAVIADPDDRPLAALALLLAPSVLFSEDSSLRGLGLAGRDWRPVALAGRALALPEQAAFGALFGVEVLMEAGRGTWAWLRARPSLLRLVALLVLGATGYVAYSLARSDRATLKQSIIDLFADLNSTTQPFRDQLRQANELMDRATLVDEEDPSPLNRVSRMLAISPRPLLVRELVEAVGNDGRGLRMNMRAISEVLRIDMFLRTSDGKRLLGGWIAPGSAATGTR